MRIYTRKGDQGRTMVIGGTVDKDHVRIEAYGTIDELNSHIGLAVSYMDEEYEDVKAVLLKIQHELFDCGTDLARIAQGEHRVAMKAEMVEQLEHWIDHFEQKISPITHFILPGGSALSALLHVSRTICRRAERCIVTLAKEHAVHDETKQYINRLSDLLFTLARVANARVNVPDVAYKHSASEHRGDDPS